MCGVARAQVLVDQHAAAAGQPCRRGQLRTWAHAHGDRHHLAADAGPVAGLHAGHAPVAAEDARQLRERVQLHALARQRLLDDARLRRRQDVAPVALPAQEVVHVHAARPEALHDLERGDAAPDDHGLPGVARPAHDVHGVGHVVQLDHAVEVRSGHGGPDGRGPRGEQQAVVLQAPAALECDEPGRGVEVGGALGDECQAERAGLLRGERQEPPQRQLAGQVVRQAGARVVAVRIGADDHELGAGVCPPDDLGRGHGARSGADEDVPCGHVSRLRRPAHGPRRSARSAGGPADSASHTHRR